MSARAIHGILLAAALSTLSDGGLAANPITTIYPGSICQLAGVQNRVLYNWPAGISPVALYRGGVEDYQGYPNGAFYGPTRVICPLGHTASQTGGAQAYVTVQPCRDQKCGTVNTTCALYSMTRQGGILAAATKTVSTRCARFQNGVCLEPLPDLIDLNLTGLGKSDGSSGYVLDCTLNTGSAPKPSSLFNIKLIEY